MATILDEIVATKREEVEALKMERSEHDFARLITKDTRGFAQALHRKVDRGDAAIIAEFKKGSPSLGCLRPNMSPKNQCRAYEDGGAACLSVLTDEDYFFGSSGDLTEARASVTIPVLRKEFIIDSWQVYESRFYHADCILLIMSILEDEEASDLCDLAHDLNMDVLVETHNDPPGCRWYACQFP